MTAAVMYVNIEMLMWSMCVSFFSLTNTKLMKTSSAECIYFTKWSTNIKNILLCVA